MSVSTTELQTKAVLGSHGGEMALFVEQGFRELHMLQDLIHRLKLFKAL